MSREELFKRTRDVLRPEVAARWSVLIAGLGSGGARVAEEVARWGTGRIVLMDRPGERLEWHNVIRHPLGVSSVGRLKTEAMRDRLLDINPDARVEVRSLDLSSGGGALAELEALLCDCDLAFGCTDNDPAAQALNLAAVRAKVPAIYGAVFDGGCAGDVIRCRPGGACYACCMRLLNRSAPEPARERADETFDYSNPSAAGAEARSTSALNLDIAQIALIHARAGLMTLLAAADSADGAGSSAAAGLTDLPGNYVLFANRPVPGLPAALSAEVATIPPDPACLVCGGGNAAAQCEDEASELLRAAQGAA